MKGQNRRQAGISARWWLPAIAALLRLTVAAQSVPTPELKRVSVDPLSGEVTVEWEMPGNPPPPVDGFIVFWLDKAVSNNYVIDTVRDISARSYTFHPDFKQLYPPMPDPRAVSLPFTVAAFRYHPWTPSLRSAEDYNILLTHRYDSCRAELRLAWYPYKGWDNLKGYRVVRLPDDGSPPETVATLPPGDTACILGGIAENKTYTYYVEAERDDGVTATGYRTEKFTRMPLPPAYIEAEATRYNGEGVAEITFSIDPASETHQYALLGADSPAGEWLPLADADFPAGGRVTLPDVRQRESAYFYRLAALHVCGDRHSAVSNTATALRLALSYDEPAATLQWNAYAEWQTPPVYRLYRKAGNRKETLLASFAATDVLEFREDVSSLPADGDVCYRVEAAPETDAQGVRKAESNRVCVQPESEVFIPQAFTPNGDGRNDEYRLSFSYPPEEYLFIAFHRNGSKVFESKEPSKGWDGRLKNGQPAGEGVYGYFMRYRTAKGAVTEKRGTFMLIAP
ncbi:MAG: gliding motility-associated C-terminal domain-containing protein [Bacteroidales bacterium]|jgi:gliding motility-associated-like protein|nr:gliding motility-associated C-terminal domain-containing protein [Bacteroidales bacterium]